jgi:Tol biopolymer transport system component
MLKLKRKRGQISFRRYLFMLTLLILLFAGLIVFIVSRQLSWQARYTTYQPRLAYMSETDMIQVDLVTGTTEKLGGAYRLAVPKAPSPDGKWLATWHHVKEANEWYLLLEDTTTGVRQQLGVYEVGYPSLAWSPDSQLLAFGAGNEVVGLNEGTELFITNVYTGKTEQLTNNGFRDDSPVFAPDGRQLAYTSSADGYNRLYVMDIATRGRRIVSKDTFGYTPSWSPDGNYIAFMSNHRDYDGDIYIIRPDGTDLQRISLTSARDEYPVWLPYTCVDGYCYTQYGTGQ